MRHLTLMLISLIILSAPLSGCRTKSKPKGGTFGTCDITFRDPVTEGEMRKSGNILQKRNHCRVHHRVIDLFGEKKRYKFREITKPAIARKRGTARPYYKLATILSRSVFKNKPVDVILVDSAGKTLRTLPYEKANQLFPEAKIPETLKRDTPAPKTAPSAPPMGMEPSK